MSQLDLNNSDMLILSRKFAQNLNKYKFNIEPNDIVECLLFDSDKDIGFTRVLGEHKFQLNINKQLCKENKTEFRKSVIYHELAHMIQYNEAFAFGAIIFNKQLGHTEPVKGKENIANNAIYYDFGHTILWRHIVKDITEYIDFKVPITDYASEQTIEKMLEELFVKTARNYVDENGHLVHVDYVIGGLSLADMINYSDKISVCAKDLREALAKVDFSKSHPITPPEYEGPNATKYFIKKFIDENGNWRDPDEEE